MATGFLPEKTEVVSPSVPWDEMYARAMQTWPEHFSVQTGLTIVISVAGVHWCPPMAAILVWTSLFCHGWYWTTVWVGPRVNVPWLVLVILMSLLCLVILLTLVTLVIVLILMFLVILMVAWAVARPILGTLLGTILGTLLGTMLGTTCWQWFDPCVRILWPTET
jgi:hypothetical protein